ncbi:hypothetical protein GCM10008019_09640 [Deinococcus soli (ex Cha et al. 2016)]|nr:hypothetical protein GCM10008019_09640 [Deinococcus soli (ex Cha et al. 2016)]
MVRNVVTPARTSCATLLPCALRPKYRSIGDRVVCVKVRSPPVGAAGMRRKNSIRPPARVTVRQVVSRVGDTSLTRSGPGRPTPGVWRNLRRARDRGVILTGC